jgi:hypothetical protein
MNNVDGAGHSEHTLRYSGGCVDPPPPLRAENIQKNLKSGQIRILRFCFINRVVTTFRAVSYNGGHISFATYLTCSRLN